MLFKFIRLVIGLALVPLCVAASLMLVQIVRAVQPPSASAVPPGVWAFAAGFGLWLVLFFTAPRPVRTYVLAHELTHALWGWSMGSKVSGLTVAKSQGSVEVEDPNFLITLAPYFFPLYTLIVIAVYNILGLFFAVEQFHLLWLGLVGFTWGFHLTFTVSTLLQKQTDIHEYGYLFSYTLIYFLNVLGIGLWFVAVTSVTLEHVLRLLGADTVHVLALCRQSLRALSRIWQ